MSFPFNKSIVSKELVEFTWPYRWAAYVFIPPLVLVGLLLNYSIKREGELFAIILLSMIFVGVTLAVFQGAWNFKKIIVQFKINSSGFNFYNWQEKSDIFVSWDAVEAIGIGDTYHSSKYPIIFKLDKNKFNSSVFKYPKFLKFLESKYQKIIFNYTGVSKVFLIECVKEIVPENVVVNEFSNKFNP